MTVANTPTGSPPAAPGAADPSMEDILASIRRILSEDEAEPASPPAEPASRAEPPSGVLNLDASMLVEPPPAPPPAPEPAHAEPVLPPMHAVRLADPVIAEPPPPPAPPLRAEAHSANETLLAPETARAAATSMGSLLRSLSDRQQVAVYRGGPTVEDLVREEIRPLLKEWLDQNLPLVVERLVRTEIERVVGRALS